MPSVSSLYGCNHVNHLFQHPLCSTQSLIRRIANIVFHILTLCIPLLIYRLILYCCASRVSSWKSASSVSKIISRKGSSSGVSMVSSKTSLTPSMKEGDLIVDRDKTSIDSDQLPTIDSVQVHFKLSELGKEVFRFVNELSSETVAEELLRSGLMHHLGAPLYICKLNALRTRYDNKLIELLKKHPFPEEDVWAMKETVEIADICFKISFVMSFLTLNDVARLKREDQSFFDIMIDQHNYYVRLAVSYVAKSYHDFRAFMHWRTIDDSFSDWLPGLEAGGVVSWVQNGVWVSENHKQFYTENTVQNQWRMLYHEIRGLLLSLLPDQKHLFKNNKIRDRYLLILEWFKEDDFSKHKEYDRPVKAALFSSYF